jgi:hypothetical protein
VRLQLLVGRARPACNAKVAELADAPDLGSGGATRGGSSPPFRTNRLGPTENRPFCLVPSFVPTQGLSNCSHTARSRGSAAAIVCWKARSIASAPQASKRHGFASIRSSYRYLERLEVSFHIVLAHACIPPETRVLCSHQAGVICFSALGSADCTASGTGVAHGLASDVISEGHLRRGSVWVHQVRFDEEAVILIDDVKI